MYELVTHLLHPWLLLHLLVWLAVLNLWRKRREGRRRLLFLTVALLLLTMASVPAMGYLALGTLEWRYRPLTEVPDDAEAIVVLSGALVLSSEEQGQYLLASDSLCRCWHALELYRHRTGGTPGPVIPVLVCGGVVNPQSGFPPVARPMGDFLRGQGVRDADLLLETTSRSTYENALEARRILEPLGLRRIVLVTDACHMARAERCFRKQGFDVVPSPCSFGAHSFEWNLYAFLPDHFTPLSIAAAAHEWQGLVWYWLNDRI